MPRDRRGAAGPRRAARRRGHRAERPRAPLARAGVAEESAHGRRRAARRCRCAATSAASSSRARSPSSSGATPPDVTRRERPRVRPRPHRRERHLEPRPRRVRSAQLRGQGRRRVHAARTVDRHRRRPRRTPNSRCGSTASARSSPAVTSLPASIAECLAYVARWVPLGPGDVIMTGAPKSAFEAAPGDLVEITVAGARLVTPCE